jgi:hypothetical protein
VFGTTLSLVDFFGIGEHQLFQRALRQLLAAAAGEPQPG